MSKHDDTRAVWGANPAGWTFGDGAEPGTREFFERVVHKRSTYEQPWLAEIVPFATFRGQRVLELGCGAGYDAFALCNAGALYTGIDITPENIDRTRSHLKLFGYDPSVQEGDAEKLPFDDASFDIVYSNGVLHHTPDMAASFREANRVLRNAGEFWVILYHRNSIFYRLSVALFGHFLRFGFLKRTLKERLSMIEFTTSDKVPLVNVYSRREVARTLRAAGFDIRGMWVRKLVSEDLPGVPLIRSFYRFIPQRALDTVGRRWGWYVIARAVKS